jgi:hypothetical protein
MEKIVIDLEAKTDKALKGIEDLADSVKDLNKSVTESNKETKKSLSRLNKGTKVLAKGFKGIGLAMKAAGFAIIMKVVDKLGEALMRNQQVADAVETVFTAIGIVFKQVSDVLIDVFKSVSETTGGFDALQKVLGGALSISINLVVGAIQGMMIGVQKAQLAWEQSFLGDGDPKELKRLTLAITETQGKLLETGERIKNAGSDIADNFVEAVGEVGSLAEGIAVGVSDSIDKIDLKSALSQAKRVVQNKKNYGLLESQSQRLVEQYDLEAETQRQIRDDDRKSISERIEANNELLNVLNKQASEEKKAIDARISALNEQVRLEGESNELTKELFDLNTELIAIDAKVAGFKSEQLVNQAALQKEILEITNSQKNADAELNANKNQFEAEQIENELARLERQKLLNEQELTLETERLETKRNLYKKGTIAYQEAQNELTAYQQANGQKQTQIDKQIGKAKEKIALDSLGAIAGVLGKNSKFGKALAITQAIRDTYTGANKAIAQGGIWGAVAAAGVIASGFANVKQITASQEPAAPSFATGGGGGGTVATPTAPSLPPAFNVVGASDTNQLAEAIGSQSQQPVQAYVVSNDVTTAQEMDRNIVKGASIG